MSKGSRYRPLSVSPSEFDKNMDRIFGEKTKHERYVPPPLPDMTEEKTIIQWNDEQDKK